MTQEAGIKVGDVVAWEKVPDGALVLVTCEGCDGNSHAIRVGDLGDWVNSDGLWGEFEEALAWPWMPSPTLKGDRVTIVALGLTGQESADDLRRLAEVFEVREALGTMRAADHATERALEDAIKGAAEGPTMGDLFAAMTTVAERLHAAGWRPGMTAEDAARLLSEGL